MKRDKDTPLYVISVAARMLDVHPQTLRMYERMGLIHPERSKNDNRLYSDSDIERVRRIRTLTQEMGVNLAGVDIILRLLDEIEDLKRQLRENEETRREELRLVAERVREHVLREVHREQEQRVRAAQPVPTTGGEIVPHRDVDALLRQLGIV